MAKQQDDARTTFKPAAAVPPVVEPSIEEPKPSPAQVAAAAQPRPEELPKFNVSWGEHKAVIRARDSREAWALFCDSIKVWPSPKTGKVEQV